MLFTDQIKIDPVYRDRLRAYGIERVEDILRHTDGRVAAWSRTTDTLHVAGVDGGPGFFVKRYYYATWRNRLRGAFRGTFFGKTRGRAEFRLLSEMRSLGLPAVRPVAHGSRRVGHFVAACFLITEEVPGGRNLTTFARDVVSGREIISTRQRDLLIRGLADQVAQLHATGFAHGQLFWRNVLVRFSPAGNPEFFFLDVRPRCGGRHLGRSSHWWLQELAHMAASARPFTSTAERIRFLTEYYGGQLTAETKQQILEIDRLAARWSSHESQRIKMNDLFEGWNRQLDLEMARRPVASNSGATP